MPALPTSKLGRYSALHVQLRGVQPASFTWTEGAALKLPGRMFRQLRSDCVAATY